MRAVTDPSEREPIGIVPARLRRAGRSPEAGLRPACGLMIAAAFALGAAKADSEPPGKPLSREELIAAAEARKAAMKNLYVHEILAPGPAPPQTRPARLPECGHREFWLAGGKWRYRHAVGKDRAITGLGSDDYYLATFDGDVLRTFASANQAGTIWYDRRGLAIEQGPVLLAMALLGNTEDYQVRDQFDLEWIARSYEFKPRNRTEKVGSYLCRVVDFKSTYGEYPNVTVWFAADERCVPVKHVYRLNSSTTVTRTVTELEQIALGKAKTLWLPRAGSCRLTEEGGSSFGYRFRLESVRANQDHPDSLFVLEFPPGSVVNDLRRMETRQVAGDLRDRQRRVRPVAPPKGPSLKEGWFYLSDLPFEAAERVGDARFAFDCLGYDGDDGRSSASAISILGRRFRKGISTHPPCRIRFPLDGNADRFECSIGINDDVVWGTPQAAFVVYGDGSELYRSRPMRATDPPEPVSLDVSGVAMLQLECDMLGDPSWDHCVWANARVRATKQGRQALAEASGKRTSEAIKQHEALLIDLGSNDSGAAAAAAEKLIRALPASTDAAYHFARRDRGPGPRRAQHLLGVIKRLESCHGRPSTDSSPDWATEYHVRQAAQRIRDHFREESSPSVLLK